MKRYLVFGLILFAAACRTPDGPRFPIPGQQLDEPVPPGLVRVVFFNTSNKIVYPTSGSVRIQLNGQTVPTVHFDNYTQVFVEPGEYDLLLEHFDTVAYFKKRYHVEISPPEAFFAVYSKPISTGYDQVPVLPADFRARWSPAKLPSQW
jgi:hypothetical protein